MTEEWASPAVPGQSTRPAHVPTETDDSALDEAAGFGPLRQEEETDLGPLFASLQPREFLMFKPGDTALVVSSPHHEGGVAIYVSKRELVFRNGIQTFHCRVGETTEPRLAKLPLVAKLVTVFIHHQPALPGPARCVYALGHVTVSQLRDLRGVIERENAAIGVLTSMEEPTRPMQQEAADAGSYVDAWGQHYPRLQLLTVGDLLKGERIEMPMFVRNTTIAQAVDVRPILVQAADQLPFGVPDA